MRDRPNSTWVTGVIMRLDYEQGELTALLDQLKNTTFGTTDIVLHRRDIIDRKPPFHVLNNAQVQEQFDASLMGLLEHALLLTQGNTPFATKYGGSIHITTA